MTALGQICDRCSSPFLAPSMRELCPSCHMGGLTAADRARLLGHLAKTGRRI